MVVLILINWFGYIWTYSIRPFLQSMLNAITWILRDFMWAWIISGSFQIFGSQYKLAYRWIFKNRDLAQYLAKFLKTLEIAFPMEKRLRFGILRRGFFEKTENPGVGSQIVPNLAFSLRFPDESVFWGPYLDSFSRSLDPLIHFFWS